MFFLQYKQNLKLISIITYIDLAFILYYFVYFSTIINAQVTNIILIISIFIIVSLLIYGAFIIKNNIDLYYLLPQALFLTFIIRAIPNLRLQYPPLDDPYYYFVATENILSYGTLTSHLNAWYPNVERLLHWPIIHILTTISVYTTNLSPMFFLRYQEPLLGIIFFIAVFSLAFIITKNYGISFIAALLASFNDIIIFYQSEYHPQGFSLILFIFIIYLFIKIISYTKLFYKYICLFLLMIIAFTFSHYFMPLITSMLLLSYLFISFTLFSASSLKIIPKQFNVLTKNINFDYKYLIIIILLPIAYEIIFYNDFIIAIIGMVAVEPVLKANLLPITSNSIPLITSFLSSFKWGLFLLATISIVYLLIDKNANLFRLANIIFCIVIAGVIGNYIIASPLDRLIAIYTPFAAIFASLTLFRFNYQWFTNINKIIKFILCILIPSLIVIAAIFNSQTPAYFFKNSEINTYYWYSNNLSSMESYGSTGNWVKLHISNTSYIKVNMDTRMVAFFYGEIPINNIFISYKNIDSYNDVYTITNPSIVYDYSSIFNENYIMSSTEIYNNGILTIRLN